MCTYYTFLTVCCSHFCLYKFCHLLHHVTSRCTKWKQNWWDRLSLWFIKTHHSFTQHIGGISMPSAYTTLPVAIYCGCDSLSTLQPKMDLQRCEESYWQSGLKQVTCRFTPGEKVSQIYMVYMVTAINNTASVVELMRWHKILLKAQMLSTAVYSIGAPIFSLHKAQKWQSNQKVRLIQIYTHQQ